MYGVLGNLFIRWLWGHRSPASLIMYVVRSTFFALVEDPSVIPAALHCISHALPQSSEAFLLLFFFWGSSIGYGVDTDLYFISIHKAGVFIIHVVFHTLPIPLISYVVKTILLILQQFNFPEILRTELELQQVKRYLIRVTPTLGYPYIVQLCTPRVTGNFSPLEYDSQEWRTKFERSKYTKGISMLTGLDLFLLHLRNSGNYGLALKR